MDRKVPDKIDYLVHEDQMVRMERTIKRLWILCIIIFAAFVVSNALWMYYESQFEEVVTTSEITQDVSQDSGDGGSNSFVGVDYGEATGETDSQNNDKAQSP